MEVRKIKLTNEENFIKVTAVCKIRRFGLDEIYFKFDKKYKDFLKIDASAFAACLMIPSMKLGEDLIIKGQISEKLYNGMMQIQKVILTWNLGLKPINIMCDKLKKDTQSPKFTASFFSGGVDSFYTYLNHKKGKDKINYFILVNGFDIELRNKKLWQATLQNVQKIAQSENIEIIAVESNIYHLIDPIVMWFYSFGGCMAGLSLLLRKKIKKVYIAGSCRLDQYIPGGSHPDIDKLWSTEKLNIIHDGTQASRIEKVEEIAKSALVRNNLRVCYLNVEGSYNCGRCEKCLRTMIALEAVSALEKSKTFPHEIDLDLVKGQVYEHGLGDIYPKENLALLKKNKKSLKLRKAIEESLNNVSKKHSSILSDLPSKALFYDHIYLKGFLHKFYSKLRNQI